MSDYSYTKNETILEVKNLSLSYNGNTVLRDINAKIQDIKRPGEIQGQIVSILGPSGIGKSSLFRLISGLQKIESDTESGVIVTGQVLVDNPQVPVQVGMVGVVAQNYPLFDHRSVYDNLLIAAKQGNKGKTKLEIEKKIDYYLDYFSLKPQSKLYPSQLSGGQKQRVAIAQQLLCSCHFLLLDEPFSGLDINMIHQLQDLLLSISKMDELNTIVIVSHDISACLAVSDTAWIMGRERTIAGEVIPGAKILHEIDLIERNLAWHKNIESSSAFLDCNLIIIYLAR
jgi:ABC-type nitrate/sulfonate/bicarbonate transport system ATPase subunit